MEDHFDRDIKQKLEGLTPEELGYRPDREKLWQQVSGKKKSKTIPFPTWITHAAAIAAGLLIGAYFFSREKGQEQNTVPAAYTGSASLPRVKTIVDTIYVAQPVAKDRQVATGPVTQPLQKSSVPVIETHIAQGQDSPAPVMAPSPVPQETIVAIAPPVQQRKVMHLSDMGNENALAKPKTSENMAFLKIFSIQSPVEGNETTLSMLIGQQFGSLKN